MGLDNKAEGLCLDSCFIDSANPAIKVANLSGDFAQASPNVGGTFVYKATLGLNA